MILKYIKTYKDNYSTVRQVLNQEFNLSYNLLVKLKKDKRILLNDVPTYVDDQISVGDVISVNIYFYEYNSNIVATPMNLNILYEDESFLILDKPARIPVHPSILHFENSLSNGVKYYFDSIGLHKKIRPVNRLDRNTSGIVIFAKNEYVQNSLSKQMEDKTFVKKYISICEGAFSKKEGTIDFPIARRENSIIERCVDSSGDIAITHYKVLKEFNIKDTICSELLINLETGRTHQIRVHLAYLGHPIIGDSLYGNESSLINRQALHAYEVQFIHPITKNKMKIISEVPKDIQNLLH